MPPLLPNIHVSDSVAQDIAAELDLGVLERPRGYVRHRDVVVEQGNEVRGPDVERDRIGPVPAQGDELARLRTENRQLRTERDILKKAAAFFAKHQA